MGACLEYLQLLGANVGVNFTQEGGESLRLEFNPEIGLGICHNSDSRFENSPFNLLLGVDVARWNESLWQFGGTAGLRFNANRRVFYNVDLLIKAGGLMRDGEANGGLFSPALRLALGWNALALESGLIVAGGGQDLEPGDRYAMLRVAFPFYNLGRAIGEFSELAND